MPYPTDRFLLLVFLTTLLAVIMLPIYSVVNPEQYPVFLRFPLQGILLADAVFFFLFLLDALLLPGRRRIKIRRFADPIFSVSFAHPVRLEIEIGRGLLNNLRAQIYDDASEQMTVEGFAHRGILRSGSNVIDYRLRVHRRGNHSLRKTYIVFRSVLGLARRVVVVPCRTDLKVYPDLKAISNYLLLARKAHLGLMGIRRAARSGGDNEFERLREYQRDDEIRHIDWKATAKHDRLIVRTFQMSRNQTVVFMVDCGRMMTSEIEQRTMLDYALDSILLLARVALDQGDQVGLLAFSDRVLRFIPPRGGQGHHRKLIRAGYDLFAGYEESNYERAFHYLNSVCRKRSLVCLVTNVIDEMNAALMRSYLGAVSGRHLPFTVLLKYRDIHELLELKNDDPQLPYQQAAAADFLLWKQRVVQELKNQGILVLEAFPDDLDANLINEYLSIKARKLL